LKHFHFLILIFLNLLVGGFIFFKNPRRHTNVAFGILSLVIASWIASLFILLNAHTYNMALIWGRLAFTTGMWAPSALLHFVLSFPNRKISFKKLIVIYGVGFLALLLTLTPWVIKDVKMEPWGLLPVTGPAYFSIILYFAMFLGIAIFLIIKRIRLSHGLERLQLIYIALGFFVGIAHDLITNMILPLLGFKDIYIIGPWNSVELELIFGYAILRYRLLDISVFIKRTSLYLLLVIFITGVYSFIIMLPQKFIFPAGGSNSLILMILSALIISLTIQPLRSWLDKITDKIFFQTKYNYFQLLERISGDLSTVVRLEDMLNMVSSALNDALHLDKLGIYVLARGDDGMEFQCVKKTGGKVTELPDRVPQEDPVLAFVSGHKQPLVAGEFRHYYGHLYAEGKVLDPAKAEIQQILDNILHASVIVPLWLKGNLGGFVILGDKKSGDQFTDRDLSFLETISNQMSVVLENTRLYEQMLANERLTILGTMSASIAHEIRNPLAAVKTFVQMLPNKYQQTEFRMRFDEIVPSELDRLTRITEDLLIFARPSALAFMPTDINALLERVMTLMQPQLRKRELEVVANYAEIPYVQADGQQLTQVFMNLLLNAIQASAPNKKIFLQTKTGTTADERFHQSPSILVSLRDEGPGISAKDYVNVFQPFFTTKHEGTGLGLPTCKRIVEAHHGEIYLDSELGRGTTFTVMLPVEQPSSETMSRGNSVESGR
jgi:signal transduction histidine kinase